MAGTLVLDTLRNGAGTASTSADNVINGSAKAWVNFNGVPTATIRASYNVSSITRVATGDYRINFTTSMPDSNYSIVASAINSGVAYALTSAAPNNSSSGTVATFNNSSPSTNADVNTITAAVFR